MTATPVTPAVAADLPGLPGVPASIGPLICPECGERTAAVYHEQDGAGGYSALLRCGDCGAIFNLDPAAYAAGLAAGVLAERARQAAKARPRGAVVHRRDAHRPDWTSCGLDAGRFSISDGEHPVTCRRCNPFAAPGTAINHTLNSAGSES